MKAYVAQFKDEEWCTLIHGKTRAQAKYNFLHWEPTGMADRSYWNDIRLRRLPGLDDLPITYENAKAAGFEYAANEFDDDGNSLDDGPDHFVNDCCCEICKKKEGSEE